MADKKTQTEPKTEPKTNTVELPAKAFLPKGFQPVKASSTGEKVTFEDAGGNKETAEVTDFQLPEGIQVVGGRFRRGRAPRLILEVTGANGDQGANVSIDSFGGIQVAYHKVA